jgi:hypothetical protein
MTQETAASDLSDDEVATMLRHAKEDEEEGRLVHCGTEAELRDFLLSQRARRA